MSNDDEPNRIVYVESLIKLGLYALTTLAGLCGAGFFLYGQRITRVTSEAAHSTSVLASHLQEVRDRGAWPRLDAIEKTTEMATDRIEAKLRWMGLVIGLGGATMAGPLTVLTLAVGWMARKVGQQNGRVSKLEKVVGDYMEAKPIERIAAVEGFVYELRSLIKFGRPVGVVLVLYLTGSSLPDLLKLLGGGG